MIFFEECRDKVKEIKSQKEGDEGGDEEKAVSDHEVFD